MHEIAKQPRTTTAGKTGFLEFTIDLPPSASLPAKGPKVTSWWFADSKLALEVSEFGALPSDGGLKFERARQLSASEGTKTIKEEPGAYLVAEHRKARATHGQDTLRVEYCRDLDPSEPPSGICCRMVAEDTDDMAAFGEQVCRSIQVKNRKVVAPSASATK